MDEQLRSAVAIGLLGLLTAACAARAQERVAPQALPQAAAKGAKCAALTEHLKSGNYAERLEAVHALGDMGAAAVCGLEALRVATRDEEKWVRIDAVKALGKIGPAALPVAPDLMEAVFAFQYEPSESVAEEALDSLVRLGPGVIPLMLPWLEIEFDERGLDKNDTFSAAAFVLGKIGAPAVPALVEALKVPSRRRGAALALGDVGDDAAPAVPALIETYKREQERDTRFVIVEALGKIGPAARAAIPLLEGIAATEPPPQLRASGEVLIINTARASLAKIRGER